MRLLSLDFGLKRIGVAISDPTQTIVRAYSVVKNTSSDSSIAEIKQICEKEKVEKIILGLPIALSGNETPITTWTREFKKKLEQRTSLPIEFEDERLSSRMADANLRESEKKGANDAEAAAVILRSYLDKGIEDLEFDN